MGTLILEFKPEEGLTKSDNLALMLLGGDCGSDIEGVDWSNGLDQDEVNAIDDAYEFINDEFNGNGYVQFNEDGSVEVNGGNAGGASDSDNRFTEGDWEQWKKDNGYE